MPACIHAKWKRNKSGKARAIPRDATSDARSLSRHFFLSLFLFFSVGGNREARKFVQQLRLERTDVYYHENGPDSSIPDSERAESQLRVVRNLPFIQCRAGRHLGMLSQQHVGIADCR